MQKKKKNKHVDPLLGDLRGHDSMESVVPHPGVHCSRAVVRAASVWYVPADDGVVGLL